MQVDIYLREKNGNREIRFPILPEKILYQCGETVFTTYDIMSRGEVAVATGAGLARIGWEADFPGEGRQNDPAIRGTWRAPKYYHDILKDWATKGTLLTVIVTGYPFNFDVNMRSYEAEPSGPFGDLPYAIELQEHRSIIIKAESVNTGSSSSGSAAKRATTKTTTYTIKINDTLWKIAAMPKHYGDGSKWKAIYDANKDIIESTAKKNGYKSSDNGHWIFPGVTLSIPQS